MTNIDTLITTHEAAEAAHAAAWPRLRAVKNALLALIALDNARRDTSLTADDLDVMTMEPWRAIDALISTREALNEESARLALAADQARRAIHKAADEAHRNGLDVLRAALEAGETPQP